jgi:hypothetical protein
MPTNTITGIYLTKSSLPHLVSKSNGEVAVCAKLFPLSGRLTSLGKTGARLECVWGSGVVDAALSDIIVRPITEHMMHGSWPRAARRLRLCIVSRLQICYNLCLIGSPAPQRF